MSNDKHIENSDVLPKPLNWLANDIKDLNELWIESGKEDTIGAQEIRKDGFTRNQRRWINELAHKMKDKNRRISELEAALEEADNDE
jgi:predicted RNase H-like nuclease (RuvC/YqgF family)